MHLSPYTPQWEGAFREELTRLKASIGAYVLDVQHVGSTAIPGLVAKPILDISVAVEDLEQAERCIQPLLEIGYEHRGENGIPRRRYFVRGNPRSHHLHMVEAGSENWAAMVRFRDHLRLHPDVVEAYAKLKLLLAAQFSSDRAAYQAGKTEFIQQILQAQGNRVEYMVWR